MGLRCCEAGHMKTGGWTSRILGGDSRKRSQEIQHAHLGPSEMAANVIIGQLIRRRGEAGRGKHRNAIVGGLYGWFAQVIRPSRENVVWSVRRRAWGVGGAVT